MSNEKPNLDDLKLGDDLLALRDKIKTEYKGKIGEGGVITPEKDLAERVLPEGSIAKLNEASKIVQLFTSAHGLAMVELGNEHMRKHKDATSIEARVQVGKDVLEQSYEKSKTYAARGEGAEPITKWGVLNTSFVTTGATNSRGTLKKIRAYANQLAAHELSK